MPQSPDVGVTVWQVYVVLKGVLLANNNTSAPAPPTPHQSRKRASEPATSQSPP